MSTRIVRLDLVVAALSLAVACRASEPGERAAPHRSASTPQTAPTETAPPNAPSQPSAPSNAAAVIEPPSPSNSMEASLSYIERLTGGADPNEPLPMIVALHGMGDRPERAFETMYSHITARARVILPRAPTPDGDGFTWFTFRAGVRDDTTMAPQVARAADRIDALVVRLSGARPTRGKALVAGFSQGGVLAYALALRHGSHYQAVIPMASFVPPALISRGACATSPQMRSLHGTADQVIPIAWDRETMSALDRANCPVTLSAVPELGHASSPVLLDLFDSIVRGYLNPRT